MHGRTEADVDNELAKEFGYYEIDSLAVTNFKTMSRNIPGGLFENAEQPDPQRRQYLQQRGLNPSELECASAVWIDRNTWAWPAMTFTCARQSQHGQRSPLVRDQLPQGATGLWMR